MRGLAGDPIMKFINIYAGDLPIRKTYDFDRSLNNIFREIKRRSPCKCQIKYDKNDGIAIE